MTAESIKAIIKGKIEAFEELSKNEYLIEKSKKEYAIGAKFMKELLNQIKEKPKQTLDYE